MKYNLNTFWRITQLCVKLFGSHHEVSVRMIGDNQTAIQNVITGTSRTMSADEDAAYLYQETRYLNCPVTYCKTSDMVADVLTKYKINPAILR